MPVSFRNYIKVLIAACLVVSFCLAEADAQTRRKRRTRRTTPVARPVITNPPIAPAEGTQQEGSDTGDVKIISTADSTQETTTATDSKKAKPAGSQDKDDMQQTITTLTNQVNKLNDRLTSMQEDDRYQVEMERLTRAEQRAEQLRGQLMDIQTKIGDYQSRLEQLDWALKPENIENSTAGYGTTRPEQIREARKKSLESERSRVATQLKLAETSKARLEGAVSNADAEVDLLRTKLQQRREQMEAQPVETPKPRKP